jgi:adenylyl-sulfate kinase
MEEENYKFRFEIDQKQKKRKLDHDSKVIWFFGLSGSGKSTILNQVEIDLFKNNYLSTVLDGDDIRNGLNSDLGFSEDDRTENLRRVAEISKILISNGHFVLCSFITPLISQRKLINSIIGINNIIWVYVDTKIEECIKRDPKGLYKKAINDEIKNFTGIHQQFEKPKDVDLVINGIDNIKDNSSKVISKLIK